MKNRKITNKNFWTMTAEELCDCRYEYEMGCVSDRFAECGNEYAIYAKFYKDYEDEFMMYRKGKFKNYEEFYFEIAETFKNGNNREER